MAIYEIVQKCVDELHGVFGKTDIDAERKKIDSKLEEAKYNLGDIKSLADCMLAILLIAKSRGYSVESVMDELERTAGRNLGRKWKKMPDGTYQGS